MSKKPKYKTIRQCAEALLVEADYVDVNGRKVGLDYITILARIKRAFPNSRTSIRALRFILYSLPDGTRLPVRRRSRKILAREYARALLIRYDEHTGDGLSFEAISKLVKRKFRDVPRITPRRLSYMEAAFNLPMPERPDVD